MKKTIISALFFLFILKTYSQERIAFYDATYLKSVVDSNKGKFRISAENVKLLKFYFGTMGDVQLSAAILKNPFLDSLFEKPGTAGVANKGARSLINDGISELGGLDVTNIANGIAQFMIKRAKEELTVTFFNRFKKFAKENPEFKVLFPKTTDNLANLLAYKYPEMLPALRTGFFEDLKNITYHLDDVMELPRYQKLLKNFPEVRVAIRSIRLVQQIQSGDSHAADVLTKFAGFKEWKEESTSMGFKNFGSSVKLASIFSGSLRNDTAVSHNSRAWITYKQMDTLVTNDTLFRIYLGLVYQQIKNDSIWFYHKDKKQGIVVMKFDSIMKAQKENLFLFQNKITEFIELANNVDKVLDTLKEKKKESIKLTNDDYYTYIDASLNVIEYGFSIGKLFNDTIDIDKYTKIARKSNDLYRNVYKKEYTQAVSNAMDILTGINDMIKDNKTELVSAVNKNFSKKIGDPGFFRPKRENSVNYMTKKNTKTIKAILVDSKKLSKDDTLLLEKTLALDSSNETFDKLSNTIEKMTKYGLFMANMVKAESADQVESVLENAALPVGSSSIKKNACFNISVQSYLGAFRRTGSINKNNNAWSNEWGVTAPIGVAFSYGFKKGGSVSLLGTLLDLGAIVDYQLKNDPTATPSGGDTTTTSKDYKIKLGQIFSPGGYVVYGFPSNIPLSLGFGAQYGPGLGKIETSGNTIVNNPQWRWNIFLAVDIPFFNILNAPKKYKP